jgi:deoxyribodipyrimidine photo-lyase
VNRFPPLRLRAANAARVRSDGDYVLYWMTSARRAGWNFALDRAVQWVRELGRPLVVLEALRCDYPWASDRVHRFVVDGMVENARRFQRAGVTYHPYVEPAPGAGRGLLDTLAGRAAVVVADEFPAFFLPRMTAVVAHRVPVRVELVDGNGLIPLRAADRAFTTAHSFRRFVHSVVLDHLDEAPAADSLTGADLAGARIPEDILDRWPGTRVADGKAVSALLAGAPIDHAVGAVDLRGGTGRAVARLRQFIDSALADYPTSRNRPEGGTTSGLSPFLHFGHISTHQVMDQLFHRVSWSPLDVHPEARGRRRGWWGAGEPLEAFLDQLVTWRELGYNMCAFRREYDRFDSLPPWSRHTLAAHAGDRRSWVYGLDEFESAMTHDPLWNAAQAQLVREGTIHNYLRMLWGKKILEWSVSPEAALEIMIELNNSYALDGRDPNSYSGIFWTLGRYDRPWGPERPVFGTVRYMSSRNTARKFDVRGYLERYAPEWRRAGAGTWG